MIRLTIANLELACWIAKLGSFTAAAERLHTTQPAVSARVRELEDMVGQKLFLRQGRGVELTVEGREFVRQAERLLRQLEELSMSFNKASAAGVVRIGTSSICLDLLAALTSGLAAQMPHVSFDVEIARAARLLDQLEARRLDIAMLSGPVEAHKFTVASLGFDRMLWVTSPQLLQERWMREPAARLSGLPIWSVNRDSFYWSDAIRKLVPYGVDPDCINAIDNTLCAARIVSRGGGVALVAETLIRDDLAAGLLVPVPDVSVCADVEFSVVCLEDNRSRLVQEIVAAAVSASAFRRDALAPMVSEGTA